jgi:OTU domain-containing protein 6
MSAFEIEEGQVNGPAFTNEEEMTRKHNKEKKELEGKIRALTKTIKKSNRSQVETQIIQLEYALKEKHMKESNELEEFLLHNKPSIDDSAALAVDGESNVDSEIVEETSELSEAEKIKQKKAKAKAKKDKKVAKQIENDRLLEEQRQNAGPSMRQIELDQMNALLARENLIVKEVISDGNCLYHAIADQLDGKYNYLQLRKLAADYMREHEEDFAPFLDLDGTYEEYIQSVASPTAAVWGGQVEVRAIANKIERTIFIYDTQLPLITMGPSSADPPVRLTFHRHYYTLGEHYNSVTLKI